MMRMSGWNKTRLVVAAGVSTLLAAGGVVFAQPPQTSPSARKAVVVDLSADRRAEAEILREVRRALSRHLDDEGMLDYEPRDIDASLNAGGEVEDRQNIATARGFYDAGRGSMAASDYEDAVDQFTSAQQLFESSFAVLEDPSQYARTMLLLGDAYLQSGDAESARKAFDRAAMMKVGEDGALSSRGKAMYARARAELSTLPVGAVEVKTNPPFAEVYVDGRYKGISPRTLGALPLGPHVISVTKNGYTRATTTVVIDDAKLERRELSLRDARRRLLYDGLKPKLSAEIAAATGDPPTGGEAVGELGTLFRAEVALITRITGSNEIYELELYVFHVATRRLVSKHVARYVDWSSRNRKAVEQAVDQALDIDWIQELGGTPDKAPKVDEGGLASKWWFWTLMGVAVAGATTAAIVLSQGDEDPQPFDKDGSGAIVFSF